MDSEPGGRAGGRPRRDVDVDVVLARPPARDDRRGHGRLWCGGTGRAEKNRSNRNHSKPKYREGKCLASTVFLDRLIHDFSFSSSEPVYSGRLNPLPPVTDQKFTRAANWNARGPPVPNTPPAVCTAEPKENERKKPGSPESLLSLSNVFWNPEKSTWFTPRIQVALAQSAHVKIEGAFAGLQLV